MKFGELAKRVLTAAIGVPVLIYAFLYGGYFLLTLVVFVMFVGLWEFFSIMELKKYKPVKIAGYVSGLFIVFSFYFFQNPSYYFIVIFCALLLISFMGLFEKDNQAAISGMSGTIFAVLYIPGLLSFSLLIRNLGLFLLERYKNIGGTFLSSMHISEKTGVYGLFFVVAVVFMNDTGAYFVGKNYGKNRVAPNISPKKSWEGVIGGIVSSLFTGAVIWYIVPDFLPLKHALILSGLLSIAALIGDLIESKIKRDAGIKDSGTIFPGHGGVMDRIDALLLGLPVSYVYFMLYYRSLFIR